MSEAARDLVALILAKLASGDLPHAKPETVWAGKGTGDKRCSACGLTVAADDVECEADFADGSVSIRLHRECLIVWDKYREDQPPTARDVA